MKKIFLVLLIFIGINVNSQDLEDFIPIMEESYYDTVLNNGFFIYCYDEHSEQPRWTLHKVLTSGIFFNTNVCDRVSFKIDRNILTKSANNQDYVNSGWDRGHMVPAADMKDSICLAYESTFYYSNVCPQYPTVNRIYWKKIEEYVRDKAINGDEVWVVSGPIFLRGGSSIGNNMVLIPDYFFKSVLTKNINGEYSAFNFIVGNCASTHYVDVLLETSKYTINDLEKTLKIDLFPGLNDSIENIIESRLYIIE